LRFGVFGWVFVMDAGFDCPNYESLTLRQQKFVDEYLVDLNATQAAMRAGYSNKSARQQGSENLSKPAILEAVKEKQKERQYSLGVSQSRVVLELACIAYADPRQLLDESGALRPVKDWPDFAAAAVKSFKVSDITDVDGVVVGKTHEIAFWDKLKANELLGKHQGMFKDNVELSLTSSADALQSALARVRGGE
jgi:phage terminase small subunit